MIARAVALRRGENGLEVLLVRSSSGKRWTFPGGHIDGAETATHAALRELEEEAGYQGKIHRGPLVAFASGTTALFFFVYNPEPSAAGEEGRQPTWLPIPEGVAFLARHRDLAELANLRLILETAEQEYQSIAEKTKGWSCGSAEATNTP